MSVSLLGRICAAATVVAAAVVTGTATTRLIGADSAGRAASPQTTTAAVQTIPLGVERFGARPGEKGATYYWLEGQAQRVTTRFADAVTVAERNAVGGLQTKVTDRSGNELARLHIDRIDDTTHVVHYASAQGDSIQAMGQRGTKPTLDWANQQAYALWRDRIKSGASLDWQSGLMRARGAPVRDGEGDIQSLDVEWAGGLSAKVERRAVKGVEVMPGRVMHGAVIVAHVLRDGREVGVSNWFPTEQLFLWKLPGISEGYFDRDVLKAIGGWRFQPDVFWVGLQTLAFHHFKSLLNDRGTVAARRPGVIEKLAGLVEPTLHANEPGCDDLHWLDGTIYRFCCDTHDYCYAKNGCSSYSWWQWWSSWTCDVCNMAVVYCFGGTTRGILYPYG